MLTLLKKKKKLYFIVNHLNAALKGVIYFILRDVDKELRKYIFPGLYTF